MQVVSLTNLQSMHEFVSRRTPATTNEFKGGSKNRFLNDPQSSEPWTTGHSFKLFPNQVERQWKSKLSIHIFGDIYHLVRELHHTVRGVAKALVVRTAALQNNVEEFGHGFATIFFLP